MRIAAHRIGLGIAASALMVCGAVWAQESGAAPAPAKPSSNMRMAIHWKRFDYTCDGGAKLVVYSHDQMVKVSFKDKTYFMKQTRSADGGRYSDGKMVWWGKGDGGFLQEDWPDGNGAMMAKDCNLDKPIGEETNTGVVSGTVRYMLRIALPETAVVIVQLQDVSLADAPSRVVSEEQITLAGKQVPVSYELHFDVGKIDPKHTYSVSARVLVDGHLRFINDASYQVLTHGNANHADLVLKQVPAAAPAQK